MKETIKGLACLVGLCGLAGAAYGAGYMLAIKGLSKVCDRIEAIEWKKTSGQKVEKEIIQFKKGEP